MVRYLAAIEREMRVAGPRLREIDGLRGWAALCVVVFHLLQETMSILHPVLTWPCLRFFMDGPMAVYVFFVLSGDALSTAYVSRQDVHALDRVIAKRYFRLSVPILFAVIPTYVVLKLGLTYNDQAGDIVQMAGWFRVMLQFPADFYSAVDYSLAGVYGWTAGRDTWNNFLWTMPVELVGSLLVFSYLHIIFRLRHPLRVTIFLIILGSLASRYYGLFFVGIFLAQLRAAGVLERIRQSIYGWIGGPALLLAAYVLETRYHQYPWPAATRTDIEAIVETYLRVHAKPLLGVLIVCAVYISIPLVGFCRNGLSRLLGRWSFGLYLFQFPVLCSFESYLIVTHPKMVHSSFHVALAIAAVSIALTMILAEIFSRFDNYVLAKIGDWLATLFKPVPRRPKVVEATTEPVGHGGSSIPTHHLQAYEGIGARKPAE